MNIKDFLTKYQFENKINVKFFLFEKKIFFIFLIIIYLFFLDNKNSFEKIILILLIGYLVYTYLNKKHNYVNIINDGGNNLLAKFIIKVKEYAYKK